LQGDQEHEKQNALAEDLQGRRAKDGRRQTDTARVARRSSLKSPRPEAAERRHVPLVQRPIGGIDADNAQSATWYTDGSLMMNNWATLRCTGFGVVVVSNEGKLLGYGYGSPPSRIATAAAAELWAIDFVISLNAFPPKMKTDCMSILTSARGGTIAATCASRPLARLWRNIAENVGIDISTLLKDGLLTWVPAHLSIKAVGEKRLQGGQSLIMIDWRANRLVDLLAKLGANANAPSADTQRLLKSASVLAKHMAAQLGEATYAANNCKVQVEASDGTFSEKICRDSMPKPQRVNINPPPRPSPPSGQTSEAQIRCRKR